MTERFPQELLVRVVARLRALADENRLHILLRLRECECNVTTLAGEISLAQASVSKHLAVLRRAGLVEADRRGTQAIYRVKDGSVFEMCDIVCDGVVRQLREEHSALADALDRRRGKRERSPRTAANTKNTKRRSP